MSRRTVLVIDDEPDSREVVFDSLEGRGYSLLEAPSGDKALALFANHEIDLVICDLVLPGMSGIEILQNIKQASPDTVVVMLTGFATVDSAVEAMRLGAFDYITKPIRLKELRLLIERALEHRRFSEERDEWRRQVARYSGRFVGKSAAMKKVFHIIEQVAPTNSTVLITGETGTGKDQVAREIHEQSRRSNKPLIKVDCASLPESLLESELFGHVKGAFTGAVKDRKGRFELADGGTIFLNEIGEMSASAQQRLLRILQDSELERVGDSQTVNVDVRVIAATNKDLPKLISENKFREDLFYRLRVVQIHLAPLRERQEDIPVLARLFLQRYSEETGKTIVDFEPEVLDIFNQYAWNGNVRELQHMVENISIFANGERVTVKDLPQEITHNLPEDSSQVEHIQEDRSDMICIPVGSTLEDAELEIIRKTLESVGGNKEQAARVLGLSRSSLYRRLPKL